ncbi:hypothetical protein O181_012694 [Austropuccinia psidii MF-1]|uniref:Uncharacterized protein n=1 Tax=Austropuccinia psidii MF-1 TaxID=1389203 RepID=A0A9Q3BV27_9BASI|nr:hypothetical protein [Austropuccinia psidii MF-1]
MERHIKLTGYYMGGQGNNIHPDKKFLILVPNETDIASRNTDFDHRNSSTIHNTHEALILEPVILSPALDPVEASPPSSNAHNLLFATPNFPMNKGYSYIPENKTDSSQ